MQSKKTKHSTGRLPKQRLSEPNGSVYLFLKSHFRDFVFITGLIPDETKGQIWMSVVNFFSELADFLII